MVTGLSVARERELGTFDQLLVSPLGPGEIIVGKTAAAFVVGIGEGTLMVTVAVFVFHVPLTGSVALLYASMAVYLLAMLGIGLFISSLAEHAAAGDPRHVLVHGADDAAYRDLPAPSKTCRTGCNI